MEPEGSSPVPILSQINSVNASSSNFLKLHLNIFSLLCWVLPSGFFLSGFPTKTLYAPLLSSICVMCPAHLILFCLITQVIFDKEYESLSCILCSFLHSPLTSSFLIPNILLSTLFCNSLSLYSSPSVQWLISTPTQNNRQHFNSVYLNFYIFG